MGIDTSVLAAIVLLEPERRAYLEKMAAANRVHLSAASLVEVGVVLTVRGLQDVQKQLGTLLERAGVVVIPVDEAQALLAVEAYRRYGKGRHPAGLNLGDCFPYSLAVRTGDALLFKGDDFGKTDVQIA